MKWSVFILVLLDFFSEFLSVPPGGVSHCLNKWFEILLRYVGTLAKITKELKQTAVLSNIIRPPKERKVICFFQFLWLTV